MQLLHGRNQPIMLRGPGRGRGPKGRSRFPKGREGVGQPAPSPPARGYEGMLVRGRALAAKRFSCILEAPVLKPVGRQFWRGAWPLKSVCVHLGAKQEIVVVEVASASSRSRTDHIHVCHWSHCSASFPAASWRTLCSSAPVSQCKFVV